MKPGEGIHHDGKNFCITQAVNYIRECLETSYTSLEILQKPCDVGNRDMR